MKIFLKITSNYHFKFIFSNVHLISEGKIMLWIVLRFEINKLENNYFIRNKDLACDLKRLCHCSYVRLCGGELKSYSLKR